MIKLGLAVRAAAASASRLVCCFHWRGCDDRFGGLNVHNGWSIVLLAESGHLEDVIDVWNGFIVNLRSFDVPEMKCRVRGDNRDNNKDQKLEPIPLQETDETITCLRKQD